jgi:hypothetical protein
MKEGNRLLHYDERGGYLRISRTVEGYRSMMSLSSVILSVSIGTIPILDPGVELPHEPFESNSRIYAQRWRSTDGGRLDLIQRSLDMGATTTRQ